jgi:Flp pilus assembly pilin Flp
MPQNSRLTPRPPGSVGLRPRNRLHRRGATSIEYAIIAALIAITIVLPIMYVGSLAGWQFNRLSYVLGDYPSPADLLRDCEEYAAKHVDDGQLQYSEFAQMNDDHCTEYCSDDWQDFFDSYDANSDTFLDETEYTNWSNTEGGPLGGPFRLPPKPPGQK